MPNDDAGAVYRNPTSLGLLKLPSRQAEWYASVHGGSASPQKILLRTAQLLSVKRRKSRLTLTVGLRSVHLIQNPSCEVIYYT